MKPIEATLITASEADYFKVPTEIDEIEDYSPANLEATIVRLDVQMRAAAKRFEFEKAAELRNMIDDVRETTRQTRRFTRGTLPSAVDPVADVQSLGDALQLPRLPQAVLLQGGNHFRGFPAWTRQVVRGGLVYCRREEWD